MRRARRHWRLSAGVAIVGTSLIAVPVAAPIPHVQLRGVRLTSGDTADSPLGDGAALVIGGSAGGNVDAANPVVVFGYSQSSGMPTFTMQQLQDQGVPSDDAHFVGHPI